MIHEINKEFYSFVWKYKRVKICSKILINEFDRWGMKMLDFKSFCLASKAAWCQKPYNSSLETWIIIPPKYIDQCNINLLMCMNIEKEKLLPVRIPHLYKEVILSWYSCDGGLNAPQSEAEIRKQLIWGN